MAAGAQEFLVFENDEVFEHVLDRLRAGVERVDLQRLVAHAHGSQGVEQLVVFEALGGEEVRVSELVVGGEGEAADVVGFGEPGMVVADELAGVVAGPIKKALAVDGRQPHALGGGEVDHERVRLGENQLAQALDHRGAARSGEGRGHGR